MVTKVGMPPGWDAIGRDKKGWVYRWRKGTLFVEHNEKRWYWYSGIKTKHMHANGAFTDPVACAVACELARGGVPDLIYSPPGGSWRRRAYGNQAEFGCQSKEPGELDS